MLDIKQMEAFLWVATLKSFRKTAEHLRVSQPAISSRISKLEDALRVKLLERDKLNVALTPKGSELLPDVEKILRMVATLHEKAAAGSHLAGVLRLGVSETIVHTWLPRFLDRIDEQCPQVDVEIVVDITNNLRNELVNRSIDLAFLNGPVSETSIDNVFLCSFPVVLVASPLLGIPATQETDLEDLVRNRILTHSRKTSVYEEVSKFFRDHSEQNARIVPSSSLATCKDMAINGIGIGTMPRPVVAEEIKDGRLVEINTDWRPSDLKYTASFPIRPHYPISDIAVQISSKVATEYQNQPTV